jgi:hypothetical protein
MFKAVVVTKMFLFSGRKEIEHQVKGDKHLHESDDTVTPLKQLEDRSWSQWRTLPSEKGIQKIRFAEFARGWRRREGRGIGVQKVRKGENRGKRSATNALPSPNRPCPSLRRTDKPQPTTPVKKCAHALFALLADTENGLLVCTFVTSPPPMEEYLCAVWVAWPTVASLCLRDRELRAGGPVHRRTEGGTRHIRTQPGWPGHGLLLPSLCL